jgi:hypothetical protein
MRTLIGLAVVAALTWGLLSWGPSLWGRAVVTSPYSDLEGIETGTSYALQPGAVLAPGDAVCYRLGTDEKLHTCFAWVVGTEGARIEVKGGVLLVDGAASRLTPPSDHPDCGPLPVPTGHVFVVSKRHRLDSFAFGPIPLAAIRGRLTGFP